MKVEPSTEDLERTLAALGAVPDQISRATKRAVQRTTDFVAKRMAEEMASRTDIPAKVFRDRRVFKRSGIVWFGYNPLASAYAGKLKQDIGGAYARSYYFEKGFVAKMPSGHVGIFKRAGKARLPIIEQKISLPQAEAAAEKIGAEAQEKLSAWGREEILKELGQSNG